MLPKIKYWPVNWVDGMKITEKHFIHLENSLIDRMRDSSAVRTTALNYGLLPSLPDFSSLELNVTPDQSGLLRIRLISCRAITAGGIRIEINSDQKLQLNSFEITTKSRSEEPVYIIVAVNPFQREPAGEPDISETPLRYPYALPSFSLQVIPATQLNTQLNPLYHVIVGRLRSMGSDLYLDSDYIPPSSSIGSYPQLMDEYNKLGNFLGEVGVHATSIVQKVKSEKQKTDLSVNIMNLSENIVFFLANRIAAYRWIIVNESPVHLVETFLSFSYLLKSSVDCLTEKDREQMFSYFQQWTELTPAQFQMRMTNLIEKDYNHQDIGMILTEIRSFISVVVKLFSAMSKLKFIGDQPDSGVVIGETIEPKKPEPKRGWSFLND